MIKTVQDIFKPFQGFQKELGKEIPLFLLGIAMESPKGLGWKRGVFIWPFIIAFLIAGFLLLRTILIFFF